MMHTILLYLFPLICMIFGTYIITYTAFQHVLNVIFRLNAVMPLAGGQGGIQPTRNLGFQLTVIHPEGGRLFPPHYSLPTRI